MQIKKRLLILLLLILASQGVSQAADSVAIAIYNATEDVYVTGENLYMTAPGGETIDYEMRISVENDVPLLSICLGFRIFSDNGATWKYNAQPGGYGIGLQAVTVASGSRLDPPENVFDMTGLLVFEANVDGAMSDSILIGGAGMMSLLPPGAMEHMLSIHFSLTGLAPGETRGICFDSTFLPPSSVWSFVNATGITFAPAIGQTLCFLGALTGVDEIAEDLPFTYSLKQNYPNPFNPTTTIEFSLPRKSHVSIAICNLLGQRVKQLVYQKYPAGDHRVTWDGTTSDGVRASTGTYFYRLETEHFVETKRMVLLK